MSRFSLLALIAAALAATGPAFAHGLRLEVEAKGACLIGRVSYSDGWPGAQEVVRVAEVGAEGPEQTVTADDQGRFAVAVAAGRAYQVTVSGDEEHTVRRTVQAGPSAQPASTPCPVANEKR
jgi:hypothetical protein